MCRHCFQLWEQAVCIQKLCRCRFTKEIESAFVSPPAQAIDVAMAMQFPLHQGHSTDLLASSYQYARNHDSCMMD